MANRGIPGFGVASLCAAVFLSACSPGGFTSEHDGVYAPGVDRRAEAEDHVIVGHRLIASGEHELAIRAFTRAAIDRGETDAEILLGLATANLGLGRLHQAEELFRLAIEKEDSWPELWNNLGVVLMERGEVDEASRVFRHAYALDNGASDDIRDNLRLALSRSENSGTISTEANEYKLVRRGAGDYLLSPTS